MLNFAVSDETTTENPSLIDELIDTVAVGDAKQRQRVLQRITDLFLAGSRRFSDEQIVLFDDVLQRLAADIEVAARARLATRLAGAEQAPPGLVRALAFDDEIAVAGPVLTHSQQLSDEDLAENARSKSQEHLYAIAQRLKLSETVTDVLVERGDARVVRKVARNKRARFSLAGYDKLVVHARRDRRLTVILGQRGDLPRQCFLKLLENASASVRAKLEAANPRAASIIRAAVDDVATTMQREVREASHEYSAAARNAKHRFRRHPVAEADVHAPAHAQEFEKTAVALAKLGCFPIDLVERALLDQGEDMILVLAKAAGCSWSTARELLLMYAAKRRLQPDELSRAVERYGKLGQATARSIIAFYKKRMEQHARGGAPAQSSTNSRHFSTALNMAVRTRVTA
jgi:uncharacterized protein (DUF2336 family)